MRGLLLDSRRQKLRQFANDFELQTPFERLFQIASLKNLFGLESVSGATEYNGNCVLLRRRSGIHLVNFARSTLTFDVCSVRFWLPSSRLFYSHFLNSTF